MPNLPSRKSLFVFVLSLFWLVTGTVQADEAKTEMELLPFPFAAEEIAATMQLGLQIKIQMSGPQGEMVQGWTVVSADEEGCEIEYTNFDAEGNVVGEKQVQRSGWLELRNHASFPVAHGKRESERRDTPLGELSGWLYTVENPQSKTVTEFFFAEQFAGAPVWMVTKDAEGNVLSKMEQLVRSDV